jgi:hypothetical protein
MKRSRDCDHSKVRSTTEDGAVCCECGLVLETGRTFVEDEGSNPLFRPYTHKEFEILRHVKNAYNLLGKFYEKVAIPTDIPLGIGASSIAAMIVLTNTTLDEAMTCRLMDVSPLAMKRVRCFYAMRACPPIHVAEGFCYRHGLPNEIRSACVDAVRMHCMKDATMVCECICLMALGRVFQLRQVDVRNYLKKLDLKSVPDIRPILINFMFVVSDCMGGELTTSPIYDHRNHKGGIEECAGCMRFVDNHGRFLLTTGF